MRGPRRIGLLAISGVCLFAFIATSAFAADELLTKNGGTRLRDLTTAPAGSPDSLEFVNSGSLVWSVGANAETCSEIELGAFVKTNPVGGNPELALPWGVVEGDSCSFAVVVFGPVTADAAHPGALQTSMVIKDDEPAPYPIHAEVTNFEMAFGRSFGTCIYGVIGSEKLVGLVTSPVAPYGEERAAPNLMVSFGGTTMKRQAGSGELCYAEGTLDAEFVLETPSTNTDGAFYS
jgi:hypothetical protein